MLAWRTTPASAITASTSTQPPSAVIPTVSASTTWPTWAATRAGFTAVHSRTQPHGC